MQAGQERCAGGTPGCAMTALEQPDSVLAAASLLDWPAWLRACSIDIESNPAQDNCIFRLAAFAEQTGNALLHSGSEGGKYVFFLKKA